MYKVAIIDDEPLIVEGLSRTMAWEKWKCQVIGTAGDGQEGMEMIREKRPDIVITDICMPKMDGLRMIAGLKSEFPDMQLIILTGYREFEYAREAISLGVARFLLKPSRMNELEEAMDTVTGRLDQENRPISSTGFADVEPELLQKEEEEEEKLYRKKRAGIYSYKFQGKAAAVRCGGAGICQSVAFVKAFEQAYGKDLLRYFERRAYGALEGAFEKSVPSDLRCG